jgi:DeoR/GlpR family transcriptional regulator of sugar metabolism
MALSHQTQGYTMEQIATQLGVSQATITGDLRGLSVTNKPPRPKGGRPKGNGKRRPPAEQSITVRLDTKQTISRDLGNLFTMNKSKPAKTASNLNDDHDRRRRREMM